jgi:phage tail sheath protein FI
MPEYLSPGVYIEEFEIGAKPIEGVSTSTAGFLGEAERGPTTPYLVTSWPDYQRKFGSFFGADKYLPYAVQGFFANGGQRCFIARIVDVAGATIAAVDIGGNITAQAVGEGQWGNRLHIVVAAGSTSGFKLKVFYWSTLPAGGLFDPDDPANKDREPKPTHREDYDDLEVNEASPNYFDKRVNNGLSALIKLEAADGATIPPPGAFTLDGGEDGDPVDTNDFQGEGATNAGERKGLNALDQSDYEDISIIYAPNVSAFDGLLGNIITHCENNQYRFAIIDSPPGQGNINALAPRNDRDTKYASFYYPWIKVIDAVTGARKLVPPGGHVAGIYARSDIERGVFKAPANEIIRGAVELEFQITKAEQDILNPKGVNALRTFPGRGRRVWGARTMSSDPLWKYNNVRRLFIYLEASIFRGTQWVVFEPNDERLWARVRQTITQFLRTEWRAGALMGLKEEEAFFVKADRTTMTQNDIDNGRLIVVIGVAPVKPAEFVIFRIAQFTANANA